MAACDERTAQVGGGSLEGVFDKHGGRFGVRAPPRCASAQRLAKTQTIRGSENDAGKVGAAIWQPFEPLQHVGDRRNRIEGDYSG